MPHLIIESKEEREGSSWVKRKEIPLELPFYRIGRSKECEICLDWWEHRRLLSAVQCRLYEIPATMRREESGYKLKDGSLSKPSTNGCWLKGVRLKGSHRLVHEDTIGIAPGLRLIYCARVERKVSEALEDITMTEGGQGLDLMNLAI